VRGDLHHARVVAAASAFVLRTSDGGL
jgi:hypothetical protein